MFRKNWVKLLLIPLVLLVSIAIEVEAGRVRVKGYYRKDGTYVRPHYRTAPDSNPYNNYSFPGNYNPNTGKITPGDPQKYLDRYYKRSTSTYKRSTSTYKSPKTYKRTPIYKPSYKRSTPNDRAKLYKEVRQILNGAVIIADNAEKTYLGKIGGYLEPNSIFNRYGQHGSDYASKSIFTDYGIYGSDYSAYSPFSKYATSPPYIVKNGKAIARLSTNKSLKILGNVVLDPYVLMFIYDRDKR